MFGGRNFSLILLSWISGWALQLSTNNRIFLFCLRNLLLRDFNQATKMSRVIHALRLDSYRIFSVLTFIPRKQRGFADFPMISGSNFSPVALQQSNNVILSFAFLPPFLSPFFTTSDLSGSPRKNNPVSSALKTSFNSYPSIIDGKRFFQSSIVSGLTSAPSPLRTLSADIVTILKTFKPSVWSREVVTVFHFHRIYNCLLLN